MKIRKAYAWYYNKLARLPFYRSIPGWSRFCRYNARLVLNHPWRFFAQAMAWNVASLTGMHFFYKKLELHEHCPACMAKDYVAKKVDDLSSGLAA